jgi:hypothetical protein
MPLFIGEDKRDFIFLSGKRFCDLNGRPEELRLQPTPVQGAAGSVFMFALGFAQGLVR